MIPKMKELFKLSLLIVNIINFWYKDDFLLEFTPLFNKEKKKHCFFKGGGGEKKKKKRDFFKMRCFVHMNDKYI
jgi:hypothetical protein